MSLVAWTADLALGHDEIDNEHRSIIIMLNTLNDGIAQGGAPEAIKSTIGQITTYVRDHFAREERLMAEISYAATDRHREEHQKFTTQFDRLRCDYVAGKHDCLDSRLLMLLSGWWVKHIRAWDTTLLPRKMSATEPARA